MLLIEKQALVQTIIRESARALATGKGREVSAIVSAKAVITLLIHMCYKIVTLLTRLILTQQQNQLYILLK